MSSTFRHSGINPQDSSAANQLDMLQPVSQLFSDVKLDENNFLFWKQQVYLTAKRRCLHVYLDGTAIKPPPTIRDENGNQVRNPEFHIYESQDSDLASWLLASVSPSILPELAVYDTSYGIWQEICRLFSTKSASKIKHYHYQLSLQRKGDLGMRDYLANIKSLCDHLAMFGHKVDEPARVSHILNGLPPEYEPVTAMINARLNTYDLNAVTAMLIDCEARLKMFLSQQVAQAQSATNFSPYIYGCGEQDLSLGGRGRGGFSSPRPQCQICNRLGHTAARCRYRYDAFHGQDQAKPPIVSGSANSFDQVIGPDSEALTTTPAVLTNMEVTNEMYGSLTWYPDSGASHHQGLKISISDIEPSAPSFLSEKKYDIFVSFRGGDTRSNFTCHLREALRRNKINTFMDDRIEKGDELWPKLEEAIENSSLFLVILSKNFATSKWCLEELTKILECSKDHGQRQRVIPVFYEVQPSRVRYQSGSYQIAFAQYENNNNINQQQLLRWRKALTHTSNLGGWNSSDVRDDAQLVEKIVKDVISKLDKMYPRKSDLRKYVGIHKKIGGVELLLNGGLPHDVRLIGIWGMGGIGKTTLARAVFEKLHSEREYEGYCFLENVRKESRERNGMSCLKEKLTSTLLGIKDMSSEITDNQKRRLAQTKILAVLDDVSDVEQIQNLVEDRRCFGPGSRILITARDSQVLRDNVDRVYKVRPLKPKEASRLFCRNAFKNDDPDTDLTELAENMVDYAAGIPLAVKVLGSSLCGKSEKVWKSKLVKLRRTFDQQIHNVLKSSFEDLDDEEDKHIFLDIACLFVGENIKHIQRYLDACGYAASCGFESLQDKALIDIVKGKIYMHNLIQKMGQEIVRKESLDPERRSRLWNSHEIDEILRHDVGTGAIRGLTLNLSEIEAVNLKPQVFCKMPNLKFLNIGFRNNSEQIIESVQPIISEVSEIKDILLREDVYRVRGLKCYRSHSEKVDRLIFPDVDRLIFPHGLGSLPNKLRYLRWEGYPLMSLPAAFSPEHMVTLEMQNNKLKKLWDGVQDLVNLKNINLSFSKQLIELPDFSKAKNLEEVDLSFCESLRSVHASILSLHSLTHLSLTNCKALTSLTSNTHLRSLILLDLSHCSRLRRLSVTSGSKLDLDLAKTAFDDIELSSPSAHLSKIDILDLSYCESVTSLPYQLGELSDLRELHIRDCKKLASNLSNIFRGLHALEKLCLSDCSGFSKLPFNVSFFSLLTELSLARTDVETLPVSIKHLSSLQCLRLTGCRRLRYLPELPSSVLQLYADCCISLETLQLSIVVEEEEEKLPPSILPLKVNIITIDEEGDDDSEEEEGLQMIPCFAVENCLQLDEQSLKAVEAKALLLMNKGIYTRVGLQYPGSKVPEWFTSRSTQSSLFVDVFSIPQPSDCSFIFCAIVSELTCKKSDDYPVVAIIEITWVINDKGVNTAMSHFHIEYPFESDHVCLWYVSLPPRVQRIVKKLKTDRQSSTDRPSLEIKFNLNIFHPPPDIDDNKAPAVAVETVDMIKECGICPTYAPEYRNYIKQLGLALQPQPHSIQMGAGSYSHNTHDKEPISQKRNCVSFIDPGETSSMAKKKKK